MFWAIDEFLCLGGCIMILRGSESFQYPSRKEFQALTDIMERVRSVKGPSDLPQLTTAVGQLVPHQYSGCGVFNIRACAVRVGFSNYGEEHTGLYASQGFLTDPAIQLLQRANIGTVSSEDDPSIVIPRAVTNLKLDSGIKTCLSIGVRGVLGMCTYYAFSNFDKKMLLKLRTMMQILAPHLHLAYLQATTPPPAEPPDVSRATLTPREHEIMRWVAEGKTNWEISMILNVSLNTIKFHLKNIYQKLGGVENRWTAVAQWQWSQNGFLSPLASGTQTFAAGERTHDLAHKQPSSRVPEQKE